MSYVNVYDFIDVDSETYKNITNNMFIHCSLELSKFRLKYPKNLISSHLNLNSLENKFTEVSEVCTHNRSDILFLSETKLDDSFPYSQFKLDNFKCYRADRDCNGGGIIGYIRSDIPNRRRSDIESCVVKPVEVLALECIIRSEKWIFVCLYSPKYCYKVQSCKSVENICDFLANENNPTLSIYADLNIDMLSPMKCRQLQDVCEVYGLQNLVSLPTCFKSSENPSLIDLVLTNSPRRFSSCFNLRNSISDFHNLVGCCTKIHVPQVEKGDVIYRSFKHFNEVDYKLDMMNIPFQVSEIFDDFDDQFWFNSRLISDVVDTHAPLKKRKCKARPVPFMNSEYRKACFRKSMLRNRFFKGRNNVNWEAYKRARNDATKLRNTSMTKYFDDKCNSKVKQDPKSFWPTIKPYFTDKKSGSSNQIITLNTGGKIINDPNIVSDSFNSFFSTVADHIGNSPDLRSYSSFSEIPNSYTNHESILKIKEFMLREDHGTFDFHHVSDKDVSDLIKKLKSNKSTGFDGLPPRLLKIACDELCHPIASMINMSITSHCFPSDCKKSEVNPMYKKKDHLLRNNYRPVSVLPCISKLFERSYYDQMYEYMNSISSMWLAAYRKNYGCQHVLVRFLEDMKMALDKKEHFGALLKI